jgi:hypothetical protein
MDPHFFRKYSDLIVEAENFDDLHNAYMVGTYEY